ncbi:MAG: tetratricopeptide (TPR) repeat protein/anti-sigma regulatory factor (Ser/Thr protein kinase), partial [Myxococcota bacterium]
SVRPLNDEALAYLVSRSLCCESLPELTAWISTISAGVPAVALEALRHLSACGRLSGSPRLPDVPPGHDGAALLGALIVERCAQLPASELALLRGLSVMRLAVSAELLARVVEIPAGRAVEALQSLEGRGLAVGAGRWFGQRTWDVCSSAVREAVLADAAPDSVRGLHTRALGVLDGAGFGPERCGPHALASGDALAALRYATSAAGRAEAIGDLDSALTLYSGCVELLRATDQFPDERDELLLAQARVLDEAGEWQRAVEVLDEALHAASDSRLIVECLRRRVLALGRLGNLVEARAAVGRLLDSLDGLPSSDCAASYLAAARVLRVCGALPAAEDAVGRGLAAATSANDGRVRGRLLTERAVLLASRSRADEAIESARGALDEFSAQRDEVGAAHAMEQLARSHRAEAEFSEAQRWHARAAESWERLGRPDGVGRCVGEMGVCAYLGGDVEGAVAHWRRGIRIAELSGDVVQRIGLTNNLGYVWMEAGQLEDAREAFEDGLALASRAGEGTMPATLWGNLGETLFRLDCLSAAEEAYDEAITRAQAQRATTDVLENRRRRCALWLKRGEVDRASAEADQLLAQVGEGASPAQVLALRRLLALIALGKGEDSAGESHIQAAGAVLAGLHGDQPFETALLELVRAETWLAGGALDSAATAVEKASAIFRSIGPSWHDSRCSVLSEQIAESAVAKGSGGDKAPEAIVASVSRLLAVETDPGRCIRLAAESARRLMTAQWSDVWSQATPCRDAQRMGAGPARSTDQSTRLAVESALRAAFDRNAPVESGDGVSVPIPGPRGPAGVLFVGGLDAAPERLPLLETIAACLGGALHRADLQARVDDSRQLLSVASHELRSPLNAIVGYAGLIGELPGLEGDLPEMIALIGEQGERMSGLVSDVRRLASALNPEVRVERVRPDALFEAAVRLATASAGARDVELRLKASSLVQLVDVDNECVTRLLADLIDNATRHSAAGSQVTLDLSISEKEPGMVAFRVRDRGTGIPPNDLDVIFQRFARGSRPLGEGNGLGLSIARAVARAHGGRLGVVSQDGVGSTFELLVPVVEANYG